jgi:hypothetical protein
MKEINAKITIISDESGVEFEMIDEEACVQFLEVKITPMQFTALLGRLARVPCKAVVRDLDRVGLIRESKDLIVMLPDYESLHNKEIACRLAKEQADEGWEPRLYFGSQTSFFAGGGKYFARTTQSRWVEKVEES